MCSNNREFKLTDIVKQYQDLKTISDSRPKIKNSYRDLLEAPSRKSLGATKQKQLNPKSSRTEMQQIKLNTIQPSFQNSIDSRSPSNKQLEQKQLTATSQEKSPVEIKEILASGEQT